MKRMWTISKDKLNHVDQLRFLSYLEQSLANGISLASTISLLPVLWPEKATLFMKLRTEFELKHDLQLLFKKLGFSAPIVVQIDLALKQGKLVDCLRQLTTLVRLRNEQIEKLKTELAYPGVLAILMILLLVFMQSFISDQFRDSGEHTGDLMIVGLIILSLCILYLFTHVLFLLNKADYVSLQKLSKIPFLGKTIIQYAQYLLIYDLWLLLSSGFSLQKICEFAVKQDHKSLQHCVGQKALKKVETGVAISEIIKSEVFLPESLLLLLETGNDRQHLSKSILLLGRSYFLDLKNQIEKIVVNVQPLCFILIGLCIIGMYLKLLLPMYSMMQTI